MIPEDLTMYEALQLAFDLIAELEQAHEERCEIPESAWDLIGFLHKGQFAPWN